MGGVHQRRKEASRRACGLRQLLALLVIAHTSLLGPASRSGADDGPTGEAGPGPTTQKPTVPDASPAVGAVPTSPREPESPDAIGAALRDALALQSIDAHAAAARFAEIGAAHPEIADHADLLRLEALGAAGDNAASIGLAAQALPKHTGSPVLSDLERLYGDALAALGRSTEAREAWARALAARPHGAFAPALNEKLGRELEAAGLPSAAADAYLRVWRESPTSPEAHAAGERLDALAASAGRDPRGADDWLERADRLFREGHSEEARRAYEGALAAGLSGNDERAARLQSAHCLFRLRRYAEAETAFAMLAPDDEARLFRARAMARRGDVPGAVKALVALAESESASRAKATEALWYAALLLDDEPGERERARTLFAHVADQTDAPDLVPQALWRLGWSAYREGRYAEAQAELARLESAASDEVTRLQARYWSARATGNAGDEEAAQGVYASLARDMPFSYYGFRARERRAASAEPPLPPGVAPALGPSRLDAADLRRARILLAAGLFERAAREARPLARRSSASLADRVTVARLFAEARDYHDAQSLILEALSEPLPRGPAPGSEEPWWLAWPRAYPGATASALAGRSAAKASLVWSIMREESAFRPAVVSSAGARGLLQIMPDTGARLAGELGLSPFDARMLFDPATNLRLGAHYLDSLSRRFGGRISAVAASYNAGPDAVSRWLAARGALPDDEWVEAIPYDQTRGYVKRVLRSVHVYEELGGR